MGPLETRLWRPSQLDTPQNALERVSSGEQREAAGGASFRSCLPRECKTLLPARVAVMRWFSKRIVVVLTTLIVCVVIPDRVRGNIQ